MRKVLISVALASAAFVAAPASAQGYYGGQGYYGQGHHRGAQIHHQLERDISQLENRIQRSAQRGRLSRGEAISLMRRANELRRDFYRFSRNGLNQGEVNNLAARVDRIRARLQEDRQDGRRRNYNGW